MELFIEIIKPLAAIIGVLVPVIMKLNIDSAAKKKRDSETKEELLAKIEMINDSQEVRINNLTEKVNYLYDIHKYRPKMNVIIRKLSEIIDFHCEKEADKVQLFFALDKIQTIFIDFSDNNFEGIEINKTAELIERKLSFLDLELRSEIFKFCQNLQIIILENTNGERIKLFEKNAINLFTEIVKLYLHK